MNLRISERERTAVTTPVRPGAAAGRSKSALSDIGRDGSRSPGDVGVVIRLSPEAQKILARGDQDSTRSSATDDSTGTTNPIGTGASAAADAPEATGAAAGDAGAKAKPSDKTGSATTAGPKPLTAEGKEAVSRLASRDTAVRAHEAAHQAAGGGLAGAASFTYESGPDGRRYAVGGEVPVALRPGRTPNETISNAQAVRSAALAPADPSSQDMAVAAQATQMETEARQQVTQAKAQGGDGNDDPSVKGVGKPKKADGKADGKPDGVPSSEVPGIDGKVAGAGGEGSGEATAADHDRHSLMIFSTLKAERGPTINGHTHAAGGGCAICSRAAARYA